VGFQRLAGLRGGLAMHQAAHSDRENWNGGTSRMLKYCAQQSLIGEFFIMRFSGIRWIMSAQHVDLFGRRGDLTSDFRPCSLKYMLWKSGVPWLLVKSVLLKDFRKVFLKSFCVVDTGRMSECAYALEAAEHIVHAHHLLFLSIQYSNCCVVGIVSCSGCDANSSCSLCAQ